MARRKNIRKPSAQPHLSQRRREELLGVLLMLFGVLMFIALATYSPARCPPMRKPAM
jgi:hypothetical protein